MSASSRSSAVVISAVWLYETEIIKSFLLKLLYIETKLTEKLSIIGPPPINGSLPVFQVPANRRFECVTYSSVCVICNTIMAAVNRTLYSLAVRHLDLDFHTRNNRSETVDDVLRSY